MRREPLFGTLLQLVRWALSLMGYVRTWLWFWGIVTTSSTIVFVWAVLSRLPGVIILVLTVGILVLSLVGLETALIVYEKVKRSRGAKVRRAVEKLATLRPWGTELLNRLPAAGADEGQFTEEYRIDAEQLKQRALYAMKGAAKISRIIWFESLVSWQGAGFPGINDEHRVLRNTVHEMLTRMQTISEELEASL